MGNTGAAHFGVVLADVLDKAEPDTTIAVVVLADGVDVLLFRTTEAIASFSPAKIGRRPDRAGARRSRTASS